MADTAKWLCPACGSTFHAPGCAVCDMSKQIEHLQRQVNPYRGLVAALQAQRDELQRGAAAALEAVKTLESERAANAVLTAELEQAQRERQAIGAEHAGACNEMAAARGQIERLQRERDEARAALDTERAEWLRTTDRMARATVAAVELVCAPGWDDPRPEAQRLQAVLRAEGFVQPGPADGAAAQETSHG